MFCILIFSSGEFFRRYRESGWRIYINDTSAHAGPRGNGRPRTCRRLGVGPGLRFASRVSDWQTMPHVHRYNCLQSQHNIFKSGQATIFGKIKLEIPRTIWSVLRSSLSCIKESLEIFLFHAFGRSILTRSFTPYTFVDTFYMAEGFPSSH
jgi:hypothetical protein